MIAYATGIPGSGKSYFGFYEIMSNFGVDKKYKKHYVKDTKYKYALTNLMELKLDVFKPDTVKPLVWDEFYSLLIQLHTLKMGGSTDTELIHFANENGIFCNTLIVLDECQDFLDKDDKVLVWWLTYHRRFSQDIILITQDLPLVNTKYKKLTEFFYKAMPSSRKLSSSQMVYQRYVGSQMFKTQKTDTKKINVEPDFFKFYKSGENNQQKSLVRYYIMIAFAIAGLVALFGIYYVSNLDNTIEEQKQEEHYQNNYDIAPTQKETDYTDYKLYTMICNTNLCFVNDNVYEKDYLLYVLNNEYDTKYVKIINSKTIFKTIDTYELFKKKETDNYNDTDSLISSAKSQFIDN